MLVLLLVGTFLSRAGLVMGSSSSSVPRIDCQSIRISCRNISKFNARPTVPAWPVTDEYIAAHTPEIQEHCRASTEMGQCLKRAVAECGSTQSTADLLSVQIEAEDFVSSGRVCDLMDQPLRVIGAKIHCTKNASDIIRPKEHSELPATTVQEYLIAKCRDIKHVLDTIRSQKRAELVQKCGSDAVPMAEQGYGEEYQAYGCPRHLGDAA